MSSDFELRRPAGPLTHARVWRYCALLLVLCALTCPAPAWAQAQSTAETLNVAVDPIRCWWRTGTGAVRLGEIFQIVLTCSVVETDAVQVVPDETKLNPAAIQITPFEVVDGAHPPDLRSGQRRFFQYEYRARVLGADSIGKDVPIPKLTLTYKVNSRGTGNASIQGRELTYILPEQPIRVLSLVPADTKDIRDAVDQNFARVESLGFRASALDISAVALGLLGSLMLVVTLVGAARGAGWKLPTERAHIGDRSVLACAARELTAVQRESEQAGWSEPLLGRALAALRIAAAFALDRPVTQARSAVTGDRGEGRLLMRRRGRTIAISSAVTGETLAHELAGLPLSAPSAQRQLLETMHATMETFAAVLYGQRSETINSAPLEGTISSALGVVSTLRAERIWPRPHLRRWLPGSRARQLQQEA